VATFLSFSPAYSIHKIPHFLPQLSAGEKAIRTALNEIGYCRRVARKKGFSDDTGVIKERLKLAEDGITWPCTYVQSVGCHDSSQSDDWYHQYKATMVRVV
jgi:hypothetical protein